MTGVARKGLSIRRIDSDRGDLSFNSVPKVELPGLSNGCFGSDRGDLSFDSVPKVESPGGGGTVGRSSGGRLEPGVPCDRLQGNWCFRVPDHPYTYRPDHRLGIWWGWNGGPVV